jgi:hypothetical protein
VKAIGPEFVSRMRKILVMLIRQRVHHHS